MDDGIKALQSLPWIMAQCIALLTILSMFAGMCWWVFITFARRTDLEKEITRVASEFHGDIKDVRLDMSALSARVDKTDEGSRLLGLAVERLSVSAEANVVATQRLTERIDKLFDLIGSRPGPTDSQIKRMIELKEAARGDGKGK